MGVLSWSLFLLASIFSSTYLNQANAQNDCAYQETCKACIRTPDCVWCNKPNDGSLTAASARCAARNNAEQHKNNWCNERDVIDQKTNSKIIENNEFASPKKQYNNDAFSSLTKHSKPVQLRPQKFKLQLRQGEEQKLRIQFKQAEDYPMDLYFLVDLSNSMERFRNHLSKLGEKLATEMMKLTTNFRLGFGSFVDKDLRPMKTDAPIRDYKKHYSYRNHMALTTDHELFKNTVRGAPVIVTNDALEGGLDGIMQAIVCKNEIKWRSDARHLLVHVSDYEAHIAGDGKLAGVPKPNDEKCHLDSAGYYTHAEEQDYPSLGQINWQAKKNDINIIFASRPNYQNFYGYLRDIIKGSYVGNFDEKSDLVIDLIRKLYKELVKTLTMTSNAPPNYVDVKFFAKCPTGGGQSNQTNRCDNIRPNTMVDFDVVIKAIGCPEREEDWHQTIEIKPDGINERVIIDLELICGCSCSMKTNKTAYAPRVEECSSRGILDCGVCSCDSGSFGKKCECKGGEKLSGTDDSGCRKDNATVICSGQGSCLCGKCNCAQGSNSAQRYSGNYCQCDNLSCPYSKTNKKLCGGNGNCRCGECICHSGWTGRACDCRDDSSRCRPPGGNSKVCSGAGKCECGECKCNKGSNGKFCEDCQSCPSQRCDEFKDCVECKVHKSGKTYEGDKDCSFCDVEIKQVDEIKENSDDAETNDGHFCRIPAADGSTFVFSYVYRNGEHANPTIIAEKEKKFRAITDFLAATIGVILLTLFLGFLILLIWKIITHLHDKNEFQKFTKERENSKWGQGQNPLYENPVTTFQNPTFSDVLQNIEY